MRSTLERLKAKAFMGAKASRRGRGPDADDVPLAQAEEVLAQETDQAASHSHAARRTSVSSNNSVNTEDSGGSDHSGVGAGLLEGYEELINGIIRPPRATYDPSTEMGPATFPIGGKHFQREDLELTNKRGLKLQCSWWSFDPRDAPAEQLPCVIYLHGNASCRIAAFPLLQHLLPCAITVFALDCSGSGLSEGEYVSLGFFEREDVGEVIAHLRASGRVSTIALWGQSMGATTALLYGDRDPSIAAMVLDSAFADLMQLANEIANSAREQGLRVPGFAISMAANLLRRSVRRRAGFEPRDVSPIANVPKCFIPALFAHGEHDAFINHSHSEQLHAAYAGDKNLILFDGDHNSERPSFFFNSAVIFLRQTLQVKEQHCLSPTAGTGSGFGLGAASFGRDNVRQAEEEMMRQAMMLSMVGGRETSQSRAPATPFPAEALREGVASFEVVAGVGGLTAQYYVHSALASGGSVEDAIQSYFDGGCAPPPAGWQPN